MNRETLCANRVAARGIASAAFCAILLAGCGDGDPASPDNTFDGSAILENVATNVILATYENLESTATALTTSADAFRANPTEPNLAAARAAWRAARAPWEQSEGFLFGPVDTEGIDPAIDSWPVNIVDLDAVLASSDALTPEFIDGLEGTLKGFHTIEYLLFGEDGTRGAASFTARQLEYLSSTTESLRRSTAQLAEAWSPSGGNFASQVIRAGESGSIYVSQKAAIQEFATGLITIADEVGNGKINDPYAAQNATLEESRFSANSIVDFQDNLRSLQNVYLGDYDGNAGSGLTDIVAPRDAALDAEFRQLVTDAIAAIGAIPPPFSTAIFENGAAVEAAQTAVRAVQQSLEQEISPLLAEL